MSRVNGGIIGRTVTPSSGAASGIWGLSNQQQEQGIRNWSPGPPVAGFIGWYTAGSFSGTTWNDLSGNGNHASVSRGSVSVITTTGNGATATFQTLQGAVSDGILFPAAILPSTYTLFHVTRYTGLSNQRIITGTGNNWLSGFWNGYSGVAFHEGWLTQSGSSIHGTNWVLSTDQNSLYRSNQVTRGSSGGSASTRLTVNAGTYAEYSSWNCAEIIVYNTTLSLANYTAVEAYLSAKYGV